MAITPQDFATGAAALKTAFDAIKGAIGLVREVKSALPESKDGAAVETALVEAEKAAKVAEAQIALALGYELCRRHFPPVVMLDVGYLSRGVGRSEVARVFECPACGSDTSGPWVWKRTAPPRETADEP